MGLTGGKPNTFSAGAVIVASEHNDNFDTIYSVVDGNVDNANVKAAAAIASSKIDFSGGISGTGAITYASGSHPKRSIILTAAGATVPYSDGAEQAQTNSATEGYPSYWTLKYDNVSDEHAYWNFVMPDSFDNSTPTAKVYWKVMRPNKGEEVGFKLSFLGIAAGESIDSSFGSTIGIQDTTPSDYNQGSMLASAETTINVGSMCAAGDFVMCHLGRMSAAVSATNIAADVEVFGVKIEWGKSSDTD